MNKLSIKRHLSAMQSGTPHHDGSVSPDLAWTILCIEKAFRPVDVLSTDEVRNELLGFTFHPYL